MTSTPLVSVLMPVFNSENYLNETIDSILGQSFQDFELIVINDGSTDNSKIILEKYALKDVRIRVFDQENTGIIGALNKGLQLARGKYIARMDSDDVSLPNRLSRQVEYMETHPQVGACGTWIRYHGDKEGEWQTPTDDQTIRCRLLFESVLAHPTVIMNRDILIKHNLCYRYDYQHAEDYDLWVNIAQHADLANIPEIHLLYRIHPGHIVQRHATLKIESANRIRLRQLEILGITPSPDELALHAALSMWKFDCSMQFMENTERFLLMILAANKHTQHYDPTTLLGIIQERWFALCYTNARLGLQTWNLFHNSSLSKGINLTWKQKIKFLIKCLIRKP